MLEKHKKNISNYKFIFKKRQAVVIKARDKYEAVTKFRALFSDGEILNIIEYEAKT